MEAAVWRFVTGSVEPQVKRYRNLSEESGVTAYEPFEDSIAVRFSNGHEYLYDYAVTGRDDVEHMKRLAVAGRGLSTYISQVVRERYARRLR